MVEDFNELDPRAGIWQGEACLLILGLVQYLVTKYSPGGSKHQHSFNGLGLGLGLGYSYLPMP